MKIEERFEYRGYEGICCYNERMGFRTGYVKIREGEELYEKGYEEIDWIEVHGGLTYSGERGDGNWYIGFDCGHFGDGSDIKEFLGEFPVRNKEFVKQEIKNMIDQIICHKIEKVVVQSIL